MRRLKSDEHVEHFGADRVPIDDGRGSALKVREPGRRDETGHDGPDQLIEIIANKVIQRREQLVVDG